MKMKQIRQILFGLAATVGLLAASALAPAQSGWGSLKGSGQRQGKNASPALSGPGQAILQWFRPNINDNIAGSTVIDNIDGPPGVVFTGGWIGPTIQQEAVFPFLPNPNATPAYMYATTVASAEGTDPRVPQAALPPLETFTWSFTTLGAIQRNYALYVWLPLGPTINNSNVAVFPQRFQVYEITYGNGQTWIEVVDTSLSGGGWVRLGAGGRDTNQLFPYNGTTPISIKLFNTVPRTPGGSLSDSPGTTVVYADAAMAVPEVGYYSASPVVAQHAVNFLGRTISVIAPLNTKTVAMRDGQATTVESAKITSYSHDAGGTTVPNWTFTPVLEEPSLHFNMDNNSPGVTSAVNWITQTTGADFRGTDFLSATVVPLIGAATGVTYDPDTALEDGSYEIYAWIPGNSLTRSFGTAITYEIREGLTVTTVTVNQSLPQGWVRLGTRRFNHLNGIDRLSVVVTNHSANALDPPTFEAYADTIRFVGNTNLAVHSTPVMVNARVDNGTGVADRDVVIVAAENGRIYCLDALGRGDGSTDVYWTYPSTPDPENPTWNDPNAPNTGTGPDGANGQIIAQMPTSGFDISSAFVQRIGAEDFLFIAARNGRVYCIEMAGRGDCNLTLRKPGTTTRKWSFPNDFPAAAQTSSLGVFVGSLAFENTAAGPTVFVPTTQGRMYALDANGNANRTTNIRWQFPLANQPTLGAIETTPSIEFGRVYFGTDIKDSDEFPRGAFYALDMNTGTQVWRFDGDPLTGAAQTCDDFLGGPTTATAAQLGGGMPDTVFAANENRFIYALDAATGLLLWQTDELSVGARAPLTFTPLVSLGNDTVTFGVNPMVMVPTADGRLTALLARTADVNRFGTKRAWEFNSAGDFILANATVGHNWMYLADNAGYIFGFNNDASGLDPGQGPLPGNAGETLIENDASADAFRQAKIAFIFPQMYRDLRRSDGPPPTAPDPLLPDYNTATTTGIDTTRTAFEWGETLYLMVYDFPYQTTGVNGPVDAPQINFTISVEGTSIRNITQRAKLFRGSTPDTANSGFAILAFPLQGGGANAIPPGNGRFSFTISTAALSSTGALQQIGIVPGPTTRKDFDVANPLAIKVFDLTGGNQTLAYTTNPADPVAKSNGSPNVTTTVSREDLMTSPLGYLSHGQSGRSRIAVVDRSMMALLRGPGRGLDNVRVQRRDLEWQGGLSRVLKPVDQIAFPLFEDYPVNFPNISLDYPNIPREHIRVTKDPDNAPENPLYGPVTLNAPSNVIEGQPLVRILNDTPFEFDLQVPKYQPANFEERRNSDLAFVPAGYYGRFQVFVDSSGNGTIDRSNGRREAYRSAWLASGITRDERIVITTPVVDLGSLANGTGYTPVQPGFPTATYGPWPNDNTNPYAVIFKEFHMWNEGNVNMNNVRLAKATNTGGVLTPWPVPAQANHEMSWLDASRHVWSDFDDVPGFSLTGSILLQKPRVGDRVGTFFTTNPIRKDNSNIGALQGPLLASPEPKPGRVSVTIPIGMPIGTYMQRMRVIEDGVDRDTGLIIPAEADKALRLTAAGEALEPYSDPTFDLIFKVRETRLTTSFTPRTYPMIDNDIAPNTNPPFLHKSSQPAAYRDFDGNVLLAYTSTRSAFNAPLPAEASVNDMWRIFVATLDGGPYNAGDQSPLHALNSFARPSGTPQFWRQESGPYPVPHNPNAAATAPLFLPAVNETILPETVKFGGPSFPATGVSHPFTAGTLVGPSTYMAFVGEAQKQTPSGRVLVSHLFMSSVTLGVNGAVNIAPNPIVLAVDPEVAKGRPALIQVGTSATLFYSTVGTGQAQIFWNHYNGATWTNTNTIPLGGGFESASSPQVFGRRIYGPLLPRTGTPGIELTFVGKLRSRPHSEVFYGRMLTSASGQPQGAPVFFPAITDVLTAEGGGLYQAQGVSWNVQGTITLLQRLNNVLTDLEVAGTRVIDPQTGIISFDCKLGGKVYLDPSMGTVRFSSAVPSPSAQILLNYSSRYLRVSGYKGAGHSSPTLLVDNRRIGGYDYWARPNGTGAQPGDPITPTRFVFTYGRGASGQGLTTRPYLKTVRLGVQLDKPIYTQPDGSIAPGSLTVTGNSSFFQVDPANGRIYFTDVDEEASVSITYVPVDEGTGNPLPAVTVSRVRVSLIPERAEAPVAIEQAVNETQMTATLDAFAPASATHTTPGLIWMFWTSTRGGTPDLFFQTIAPRFTPLPRRN